MSDIQPYTWPREKTIIPAPFEHQIATTKFAVANPHSFILNDIGTGKTMSALWAADVLMQLGAVRRALVVAPLSTLERVWGDAFFIHMPHRKFSILHGSSERRLRLLGEPRDFYIINHDGVGVIQQALMRRSDIDLIIIDEVAVYRNRSTHMWRHIENVVFHSAGGPKPWVWGLTGAPIPNSPEDAFGQCKLVVPEKVPTYFGQWRTMTMEHQSTYIWTPRTEAVGIVHKAMQPAIRFKRDECLDLPPTIQQTRDVELSADQKRHYKEIVNQLHTEIQGGKITAVNEGVKLSKLLQIACGCVYDVNGVPREILNPGNRVETLMELIEQVNEKVIVFVPFTAVTGMLARELNKYWNFAVVTGDTPIAERNKIFQDFQNPNIDIDIVAHPKCMSHGLTLTEASTIIWYAPIASNDIFEQANGRISRASQHYTANIIKLSGSAVERRTYARLQNRQQLQGTLLDMVAKGEL